MSSTAVDHAAASRVSEGPAPAVLVGECGGPDRHLMVAVIVDPRSAAAVRDAAAGVIARDGLWCGPAAASPRCRTALVELMLAGGISAEVIDAADHDTADEARGACLLVVATLADSTGADRVVLARDDTRAAGDSAGSARLAHRAGASPTLSCSHADAANEPLTVLAELLAWSWAQGGDTRRSVAPALRAVHLA